MHLLIGLIAVGILLPGIYRLIKEDATEQVIAGIGAVINKNRQIVSVNENFMKVLKIENIVSILGRVWRL